MLFHKTIPIDRGIYAVETGTYIGEFFVYITKKSDEYCFLSLPKLLHRTVPKKSFEFALKNKVIKLLQKLPKDIYEICLAEYNTNRYVPKSSKQIKQSGKEIQAHK